MPKFTVEHETRLPVAEAFSKVQDYFKNSKGLRQIDAGIECTFDEAKQSGKIKGSQFSCDFAITGKDPAKVSITVDISFLLTPFKGKIQEVLREKMLKVLG